MKAKIIKTGDIVTVMNYHAVSGCVEYLVDGMDDYASIDVKDVELILDCPNTEIDWEQRRYELAKSLIPDIVLNLYKQEDPPKCDWSKLSADRAIECADALIKKLKENN